MDTIEYKDEGDTIAVTVRMPKAEVAAERQEDEPESTAAQAVAFTHLANLFSENLRDSLSQAEAAADMALTYVARHGDDVHFVGRFVALSKIRHMMRQRWTTAPIPWAKLHSEGDWDTRLHEMIGRRILLEVHEDGLVPVAMEATAEGDVDVTASSDEKAARSLAPAYVVTPEQLADALPAKCTLGRKSAADILAALSAAGTTTATHDDVVEALRAEREGDE
ncbi:hypothetical protein [Streptomyces katrae]|uniref:Uncharacterized protein n=1 Tax=Streptomyces katrae TaxID=68223 RepID=A0A0F4JSK3_9ACTN|nr:hypothetical protein [Streptomyces katrae]KJY37155.1 hypothetical protein VR44_06435 [Streptomyces katrae]